jgi:hypothetical protein
MRTVARLPEVISRGVEVHGADVAPGGAAVAESSTEVVAMRSFALG